MRSFRPILWVELSSGTIVNGNRAQWLRGLFNGSVDVFRFETVRRGLKNHVCLRPVVDDEFLDGDYVIKPR